MTYKSSVDIVLPVLNEQEALSVSISRLLKFCSEEMISYNWNIIIADNGSTDETYNIAKQIESDSKNVNVIKLSQKGRGRALKKAWGNSKATIKVYMDIDLSTDLKYLPIICDHIYSKKYDIAIGSRLIKGSKVVGRTLKREIISRGYSLMFRCLFWVPFKDAQCGFKAISLETGEALLPLIDDNGWFFDTELLILANKLSYKIKEVPVYWVDDPNSSVNVISTAWNDIKGLTRLRFGGIEKAKKQIKLN
tara:strand:+ start:5789 stop:6538 length:750 start_codon:yes stop_codon:yes gene_type:complete